MYSTLGAILDVTVAAGDGNNTVARVLARVVTSDVRHRAPERDGQAAPAPHAAR
jgi:hypothetical protein